MGSKSELDISGFTSSFEVRSLPMMLLSTKLSPNDFSTFVLTSSEQIDCSSLSVPETEKLQNILASRTWYFDIFPC